MLLSKLNILSFSLILIPVILHAQSTENLEMLKTKPQDSLLGWKTNGIATLNFNNTYLSNWAAGGEGAVALNGLLNYSVIYRTPRSTWTNTIDFGYGVIRKESQTKFIKSDDKIDFLTKFGRQAYKNFYYSAALNFKTQFSPGYRNPQDTISISDFLAPGLILTAIGMDYKPGTLSVLFAPLTSKITIVNNQRLADAGAYGVEPAVYDSVDGQYVLISHGEIFKKEFGGYLRVIYTKSKFESEWLKNIAVSAKVDFFSNYLNNPQNIDVNGEMQLLFKVNKLFTVSLLVQTIYDDNVRFKNTDGNLTGPKIQFKNITGIGLTHKF